jgi:hypothetical protein
VPDIGWDAGERCFTDTEVFGQHVGAANIHSNHIRAVRGHFNRDSATYASRGTGNHRDFPESELPRPARTGLALLSGQVPEQVAHREPAVRHRFVFGLPQTSQRRLLPRRLQRRRPAE